MALYADDEEPETLLQIAIAAALRPIQILTSRPAIKAYLSTLLFLFTSFTLLAISTTAFLFFYYAYIPQVDLSHILYFQYGTPGYTHPHAQTQLDVSALTSSQPYDISIEIDLPRTPSNLDAGNFMLDLSLLSPPNVPSSVPSTISTVLPNTTSIIAQSRRPAILPYSSPILSLYNIIVSLPLHFLGFRDPDAATLSISMFERLSFARGWRNIPAGLSLEIQTQAHSIIPLQIYSAKIIFQARFQGLRWFVYNYRIISWLLFSTLFYTLTISTMAITWGLVSYLILPATTSAERRKRPGIESSETELSNGHVKVEPHLKTIKAEDKDEEDDSSLGELSDTPTTFPTLSRQMPLRFPVQPQTSSSVRSSVKQEPEALHAEPHSLTTATAEDAADDEGEEDEDENNNIPPRQDDAQMFDSGIGTSMESENVASASGIVRRRSNRSLKGKE